jgi:hypothetical protein
LKASFATSDRESQKTRAMMFALYWAIKFMVIYARISDTWNAAKTQKGRSGSIPEDDGRHARRHPANLSWWETGKYKPSADYLRRQNQFLSLAPLALRVYFSNVGLQPRWRPEHKINPAFENLKMVQN